jgi:hypothetical protein
MDPSPKGAAALNDLIIHLRECVVAITHGDSKGTGFFIAENTILTCAHVLLDSASTPVQIQWRGQKKDASVERRARKGEPDLAVLRVSGGQSSWNHPCVLLGEDILQNDPLFTFGHPDGDYREGGDSATFEYEGLSYEKPLNQEIELYKFSRGEVAPGLSGSPLLNQRTGEVCAVVRTTRQRESLLGGRAVPIRYLRGFDSKLWESLGAYHRTHPLWTSLIKQMAVSFQGQHMAEQTGPSFPAQPAMDRSLEDTASLARELEARDFTARKHQKAIVDRARYSVYAEEFITEKTMSNDGSSKVQYLIKGLQVERGTMVGLRFVFQSEAGCVGGPVLDQDAQQHQISWQWESELRSKALPLEEKLRSVKKLVGAFVFDQPLRSGDPPLDFGWTIRVLNGDALSDWEFAHIYSDVKQVHMNGAPLASPMEYFARVIWFPVGTLKLRLNLPSRIVKAPFLSVFRCNDQVNIPEDEVVMQGILQIFPRSESAWVKQNVKWQRDRMAERWEHSSLKSLGENSFELTTHQPQVGWCYSLDWILPKPPLDNDFDYLIRQSEEIRQGLIEHADNRKTNSSAVPKTAQIRRLFEDFDAEIRKEYACDKEGCMLISLMTYNSDRRRLLMAEGAGGGKTAKGLEPRHWDFWLPFGLGLAGACFREGDLQLYVRPRPESEDADYYLAISESNPYEVLIALPLDHPKLSEQIAATDPAERCRQLIGVMTLGSTYRATRLLRLRNTKVVTAQVTEPEVVKLRNRCQGLANKIVELLQES